MSTVNSNKKQQRLNKKNGISSMERIRKMQIHLVGICCIMESGLLPPGCKAYDINSIFK